MPTAYCPSWGSVMPRSWHFSRKNLSGMLTRMPAPSPLSASQPHAPRWFMFSSICSASETICVRRLALDVADEADAAGVVLETGIVQALS